MAGAGSCTLCAAAAIRANEAADESLDNFQRFYYRHIAGSKDEVGRHRHQYTGVLDRHHTRLLEVKPGRQDEPIRCCLREISIEQPPKYTALSYTWGTNVRKKTVEVDGADFLVSDNLYHALWHIRSPEETLFLWIDAICINQADIPERNHVVGHMKNIYERADRILAWLGPESENGGEALLAIASIYGHFTKLVGELGTQEDAFERMLGDRGWAGHEDKQAGEKWWAINSLLTKRTWFHRVWIVQEGSTPVPTTFQLCHHRVPAEAVYEVFRLLQRVPIDTFPRNVVKDPAHRHKMEALTTFARKRRQFQITGESTQPANFPLLDVLDTLRGHSASDPHDKVYAALGFATGDAEMPVEIDYGKSFTETLRDVAVSCLHEKEHNLRFLGHAGMLGSGHLAATWMPDWLFRSPISVFPKQIDQPGVSGREPLYNACASTHSIWRDKDFSEEAATVVGDTLRVPGILVDFVETTSVVAGQANIMEVLESMWMIPNPHENYAATNESRETAYLRTLVADLRVRGGEIVGRGGSMYPRYRNDKPADHADIQALMYRICDARKFIKTMNRGYFGLGPYWTQPGDAIFMLKGGEMLYLARSTLDGTYHFVGEAYIHGMMDGAVVDNFSQGEGTMQAVEFVPVRNEVLDSTKTEASPLGNIPVSVNVRDVAQGVQSMEFSNPYEDMKVYEHSDVGPGLSETFNRIIQITIETLQSRGMSPTAAVGEALVNGRWKSAAELILLGEGPTEGPEAAEQTGLAGRDFARREHIRSMLELEHKRNLALIQASFRNTTADGQILEVVRGPARDGGTEPEEPNQEQQSRADKDGHPAPAAPAAENIKHPPGPPVRLMHSSDTRGPRLQSYSFQDPSHNDEFFADLDAYREAHSGAVPVLFDKWATDPKFRPKVELMSYGRPGDLWWEDEWGNRVKGPDDVPFEGSDGLGRVAAELEKLDVAEGGGRARWGTVLKGDRISQV